MNTATKHTLPQVTVTAEEMQMLLALLSLGEDYRYHNAQIIINEMSKTRRPAPELREFIQLKKSLAEKGFIEENGIGYRISELGENFTRSTQLQQSLAQKGFVEKNGAGYRVSQKGEDIIRTIMKG